MGGKVISVNFAEKDLEALDRFDAYFEQRAQRRDESYSRSDEIRKAMVVYQDFVELLDELDYQLENARPQQELIRQAILDLHRRDTDRLDAE